MKTSFFLFLVFFLADSSLFAQTKEIKKYIKKLQVVPMSYGPDTIHARGLAYYDGKIYTANSNGHVYCLDLKTKDIQQLTTNPNKELRDIYVQNNYNFCTMQSNDTCNFIVSKNLSKGLSNNMLFFETKFNTFLDAFDINENGFGIMMGDPVNDFFQIYTTSNAGVRWFKLENKNLKAEKGEAGFAASGTTVQVINDSTYFFISGGKASNLYKTFDSGSTWMKFPIPFTASEASGPFSMHFWSEKEGIVVGGDYTSPNDTNANCFITKDGGLTWFAPNKTTSGYRSCVIKSGNTLYACGTNGIDFSLDLGNTWYPLNSSNTFALTYDKKYIYASTTKGKVLRFKRYK